MHTLATHPCLVDRRCQRFHNEIFLREGHFALALVISHFRPSFRVKEASSMPPDGLGVMKCDRRAAPGDDGHHVARWLIFRPTAPPRFVPAQSSRLFFSRTDCLSTRLCAREMKQASIGMLPSTWSTVTGRHSCARWSTVAATRTNSDGRPDLAARAWEWSKVSASVPFRRR